MTNKIINEITHEDLQKIVNSLHHIVIINNKCIDLLDPDNESEFKDKLEDNLLILYLSLISVNTFICSIYDSIQIKEEVPEE